MKLLNSEQSKFKNPKRPKKHFFFLLAQSESEVYKHSYTVCL